MGITGMQGCACVPAPRWGEGAEGLKADWGNITIQVGVRGC